MKNKETVQASSDVALVKYWGKKDEQLRLPENGSVSMVLAGLDTITTVQFDDALPQDVITINDEDDPKAEQRAVEHLNRIRSLAKDGRHARVVSRNNFPTGTGLSSSGSGFAALTVAATRALGLEMTTKDLSILARQGSGTAARCISGGYVEWHNGDTSDTSYAETIFPPTHWDIRDVVAVVDKSPKKRSSTEGHRAAQSSPFYHARLQHIGQKIEDLKRIIAQKDFTAFGRLVEAESMEFHSILLTSNPAHIAWRPGTIEVMNLVHDLRADGVDAYFTINTGFNVHVLTLPEFEGKVDEALRASPAVRSILHATVGTGPVTVNEHLF